MRLATGMIVAGLLSAPCAAWAQDAAQDIPPSAPPPSDNDLTITIMPYAWLAGVSGPAEVSPGLPRPDVDSDGGSIFDNLDFFGFAVGEVNQGAWGAVVDVAVISMTFENDVSFRDGPTLLSGELGLDGTVLTLEGFHRFKPTPEVDVDLLAGVRAFWLDLDLKVEGPLGGTLIEGESDNSWADFVVGARGRWTPGRWTLVAQADIGAGSDTSNWGAFLTAHYQVTRGLGVVGGYRWLEFDYGKNRRDVNLTLDGPMIGVSWTF